MSTPAVGSSNIIRGGSWTKAFAIQQNPEEFVEATKGIFDARGKRIEKEDSELYVLVDEAA